MADLTRASAYNPWEPFKEVQIEDAKRADDALIFWRIVRDRVDGRQLRDDLVEADDDLGR